MGTLRLNDESITRYFSFLKHLDTQSKKKLIVELTKSIESTPTKKSGIKRLYGAWEDDRTAEQIIHDIRSSRGNNREIEDFE